MRSTPPSSPTYASRTSRPTPPSTRLFIIKRRAALTIAGAFAPGLAACALDAPPPSDAATPRTDRLPSPSPVPPTVPAPTATPLPPTPTPAPTATPINLPIPARPGEDPADQRTIAGLRARAYEGGPIEIVRTLQDTPAYTSYHVIYPSDGHRVTAFLNVPKGPGPFPVLLINHGFVPPAGYVAIASNYVKREGDFLAARGYLTAGSDFRGHGNSPGTATGTHLETAYVIDALNFLASLKSHPAADLSRIGVWGHSNGGSISERIAVVSKEVDATVVWAGVSSDAVDSWLYLRDWINRPERDLRAQYGHPDDLPDLYGRMGGRNYLADVVGPIQIHHGTADASVPYSHATTLAEQLAALGKPHELHTYPGAPHNFFGPVWDTAITRTLTFFDQHVKPVR